MTPELFVDQVKQHVMESAAHSTVSVLADPPGRRPAAELVELSNWFNSLTDADRAMVARVAAEAASYAVFGFLVVLDGSRRIEGSDAGDHFELRHVHGETIDILSGPRGPLLHELF
jgi:hypothetical protein